MNGITQIDDIPSSTLLKSALSFEPISLPAIQSQLQGMSCWTLKSSPLHWEPVSGHPISEKFAAMKAALDSGADPNELDHQRRTERSIGRPLHYATEYTTFDHSRRHENLPLIKLLLQHCADPRLHGMECTKSPIDEMKTVVEFNSPDLKWATEQDMVFFRGALEMMKEKANELDGRICLSGVAKWILTDHL